MVSWVGRKKNGSRRGTLIKIIVVCQHHNHRCERCSECIGLDTLLAENILMFIPRPIFHIFQPTNQPLHDTWHNHSRKRLFFAKVIRYYSTCKLLYSVQFLVCTTHKCFFSMLCSSKLGS